jgi:hypothetical protein
VIPIQKDNYSYARNLLVERERLVILDNSVNDQNMKHIVFFKHFYNGHVSHMFEVGSNC